MNGFKTKQLKTASGYWRTGNRRFYRKYKWFYRRFKRIPGDADRQFIVNVMNGDGYAKPKENR